MPIKMTSSDTLFSQKNSKYPHLRSFQPKKKLFLNHDQLQLTQNTLVRRFLWQKRASSITRCELCRRIPFLGVSDGSQSPPPLRHLPLTPPPLPQIPAGCSRSGSRRHSRGVRGNGSRWGAHRPHPALWYAPLPGPVAQPALQTRRDQRAPHRAIAAEGI